MRGSGNHQNSNFAFDHMPNNELLPYNCYTLHSLVKMLQGPRDSLSGHHPSLSHLFEPPSSHPHTLTPSQEDRHWVSFHFQQSRDALVWVTKSTIMSEVEMVYVLRDCMCDIEKCAFVFQGGIKTAIFLTLRMSLSACTLLLMSYYGNTANQKITWKCEQGRDTAREE